MVCFLRREGINFRPPPLSPLQISLSSKKKCLRRLKVTFLGYTHTVKVRRGQGIKGGAREIIQKFKPSF